MKNFFASKTLWWNTLTLAGAALVVVGDHSIVADNPGAAALVMIATSVVNMLLRLVTNKGIGKDKPAE